MRCSCAALAALLHTLEVSYEAQVSYPRGMAPRELLVQCLVRTAAELDRSLAECAREVGSSVAEVRDLCAMFPPLEDCGATDFRNAVRADSETGSTS